MIKTEKLLGTLLWPKFLEKNSAPFLWDYLYISHSFLSHKKYINDERRATSFLPNQEPPNTCKCMKGNWTKMVLERPSNQILSNTCKSMNCDWTTNSWEDHMMADFGGCFKKKKFLLTILSLVYFITFIKYYTICLQDFM